jgi:hypothetical protein
VVNIFKQKSPANLLLLLVFGILIKFPMFRHQHIPVAAPSDGPLFIRILEWLQPISKSFHAIYPVLAFALLFIQAISLNQFINNRRLLNFPTYLPGMSYMLITSLFPEWNNFSAALLISTILLFILSGLFRIYNQQHAKGTIFNIGLALGIASFLFLSSLAFVVWVLLALAVMRPFRLNEWLLCILGITTPYYFYGVYLFVSGHWSWNNLIPYLTVNIPEVKQSAWVAGSAFLIAVPFLLGGYYVQENLRRMLIQVRKGWSLLLLYLLTAMLVPFVNTNSNFENWILAAIPFASFHASTYLYSKMRLIPLILFWLTAGFILAYQYYGPGW